MAYTAAFVLLGTALLGTAIIVVLMLRWVSSASAISLDGRSVLATASLGTSALGQCEADALVNYPSADAGDWDDGILELEPAAAEAETTVPKPALPVTTQRTTRLGMTRTSFGPANSLKQPKGVSKFTISEDAQYDCPEATAASLQAINSLLAQAGRPTGYFSAAPRQRLYMKVPYGEPDDMPSNFLVRLNQAMVTGVDQALAVGAYARAGCIELTVDVACPLAAATTSCDDGAHSLAVKLLVRCLDSLELQPPKHAEVLVSVTNVSEPFRLLWDAASKSWSPAWSGGAKQSVGMDSGKTLCNLPAAAPAGPSITTVLPAVHEQASKLVLQLTGSLLDVPGTTFHVRCQGRYLPVETLACCAKFAMLSVTESPCAGLLLVEAQRGLSLSNWRPVLIVPKRLGILPELTQHTAASLPPSCSEQLALQGPAACRSSGTGGGSGGIAGRSQLAAAARAVAAAGPAVAAGWHDDFVCDLGYWLDHMVLLGCCEHCASKPCSRDTTNPLDATPDTSPAPKLGSCPVADGMSLVASCGELGRGEPCISNSTLSPNTSGGCTPSSIAEGSGHTLSSSIYSNARSSSSAYSSMADKGALGGAIATSVPPLMGCLDLSIAAHELALQPPLHEHMQRAGLSLLLHAIDGGLCRTAAALIDGLVAHGYDFRTIARDACGPSGLSLLHRAVSSASPGMVTTLLERSASYNCSLDWVARLAFGGETPIHLAAALADGEVLMRFILKQYPETRDVWLTAKDHLGVRPVDITKQLWRTAAPTNYQLDLLAGALQQHLALPEPSTLKEWLASPKPSISNARADAAPGAALALDHLHAKNTLECRTDCLHWAVVEDHHPHAQHTRSDQDTAQQQQQQQRSAPLQTTSRGSSWALVSNLDLLLHPRHTYRLCQPLTRTRPAPADVAGVERWQCRSDDEAASRVCAPQSVHTQLLTPMWHGTAPGTPVATAAASMAAEPQRPQRAPACRSLSADDLWLQATCRTAGMCALPPVPDTALPQSQPVGNGKDNCLAGLSLGRALRCQWHTITAQVSGIWCDTASFFSPGGTTPWRLHAGGQSDCWPVMPWIAKFGHLAGSPSKAAATPFLAGLVALQGDVEGGQQACRPLRMRDALVDTFCFGHHCTVLERSYVGFVGRCNMRFAGAWAAACMVSTSLLVRELVQLQLKAHLATLLLLRVPYVAMLTSVLFVPRAYISHYELFGVLCTLGRICLKLLVGLVGGHPPVWGAAWTPAADALSDGLLPALYEKVRLRYALGLRGAEAAATMLLYMQMGVCGTDSWCLVLRALTWNCASLGLAALLEVRSRAAFALRMTLGDSGNGVGGGGGGSSCDGQGYIPWPPSAGGEGHRTAQQSGMCSDKQCCCCIRCAAASMNCGIVAT